MAFTVQTGAGGVLNNAYVSVWIDRTLMEHVIQLTVFDQFAMMAQLPEKGATYTARFLRQGAGAFTNVQSLTEGVPIAVSTGLTLGNTDIPLLEYGEVVVLSDLLLKTAPVDTLKVATQKLGEDCALKADQIQSQVIANLNIAGNTRFAQQLANEAALVAATNAGGSAQINDFLDAFTQLENIRAPRIDGAYVSIIAPAVRRDVLKDQTFLTPAQYGDSKRIFKGEIGEFYGVRFVLMTNPFRETATLGTYVAGGVIFVSVVTGQQGWGFVDMAGLSPNCDSSSTASAAAAMASNTNPARPKIYNVTGPDHADPLAQQVILGYKFFAAAAVLDAAGSPFVCTVRSKTQFA